MKCPRCESSVLDERERDGVTVDICRECRGIWLDRSELERIVARAMREQAEYEQPAQAQAPAGVVPPQAPPPPQQAYAPPQQVYAPPQQAPLPQQAYAPPPQGYPPPPHGYQPRYRDDDTPPHGFRRDGHAHGHHRKRHWFESLSDIFD